MQPQMKKILSLIAGWSFIVLGILGLFLPFLQGILFLLVGLIILSKHYAFAQRWLDKLRHRYPAAFDLAYKFRVRLMKRFHRGKANVADE
ncbi:MAG TPA: hypothetical protein EYN18_02940 [Nitrospirales bacterium]|nr:hypothetical protein [Nitrospirales bacterium]HIA14362.1 hypothetical protein [Nitrospirales bacterium]HIB53501.1 hypothetical protein [Nitrospirales bacterium]HIN32761.1 hypothetical protein [Nitrospirales bacterium]HIO21338.1 hypothetical protein [Nitrospirales bacterium]